MKHIVCFSGGKDSTAMLLKMLEENKTVDYIVFCDTGKDFEEMLEHIEKVRKYLKNNYNKEIITLKPKRSFDYYMFDHIKTKGKNKGKKGYGWPTMFCRWCTSNLKNKLIDDFAKPFRQEGYFEYVGIAYDEPKRIKEKSYPLYYEWKMTEKDCLKYCYEKGFHWNGLYEHFDRLSCWCCPLKNLKELKVMYQYYPKLWNKLKDMDNRSFNRFRADYSIEQLEEKFQKENLKKVRLIKEYPLSNISSNWIKECYEIYNKDEIEE